MIHSNAAGLRRVGIIRATQIPMGMNRKTHHSENSSGRSRTPVYKKPGSLMSLSNAKQIV